MVSASHGVFFNSPSPGSPIMKFFSLTSPVRGYGCLAIGMWSGSQERNHPLLGFWRVIPVEEKVQPQKPQKPGKQVQKTQKDPEAPVDTRACGGNSKTPGGIPLPGEREAFRPPQERGFHCFFKDKVDLATMGFHLKRWTEKVYNRKRPHWSLGYRSPWEYLRDTGLVECPT